MDEQVMTSSIQVARYFVGLSFDVLAQWCPLNHTTATVAFGRPQIP